MRTWSFHGTRTIGTVGLPFSAITTSTSVSIERTLAETRRLEAITRAGEPMLVTAAYDGMEIKL